MTDAQHRAGTPNPEGPQPAGGVLAQAPTALIVVVGIAFLGLLAALVVLILAGKPTKELIDALKFIFGAVSSVGALGSTLYAASAAKSAKAAREQTNGSLDARIEAHAARGVAIALGRGGPPPRSRGTHPRARGGSDTAA